MMNYPQKIVEGVVFLASSDELVGDVKRVFYVYCVARKKNNMPQTTVKLFSAEMIHSHPQSVLVRVALSTFSPAAISFVL